MQYQTKPCQDGELQFEEFLVLMATLMHEEDNSDGLLEAFDTIDKDGTGFIPLSIVRHIFEGLAENCTFTEVENILANIDTNEDGLCSMVDLKRFLALELLPNRVKIINGQQSSAEEIKQQQEHPTPKGASAVVHEI
tara:strand:- start:102 stop:512 length:411 start_codon:yes stop_codon:yes gene_type:complete